MQRIDKIKIGDKVYDLGSKCEGGGVDSTPGVITGYYTGNGDYIRTMNLGFTPVAVLLRGTPAAGGGLSYLDSNSAHPMGFAATGRDLQLGPVANATAIKIVPNGFQVQNGAAGTPDGPSRTNTNNVVYTFIAFMGGDSQ